MSDRNPYTGIPYKPAAMSSEAREWMRVYIADKQIADFEARKINNPSLAYHYTHLQNLMDCWKKIKDEP